MKRRLGVLIACAALVLAAGCGSSKSSSTTSATTKTTSGVSRGSTPTHTSRPASAGVQGELVQISYHEVAIQPRAVKVKVGTTIRWTNHDPVEHNVTSHSGPAKFASKDLGEGGAFEFKVTKPGVIRYGCTIHPATMNGTIEVVR